MVEWPQVALALAEGAGLAFSPCILPILPLLLAGSAAGSRWRPLQIVAGFVASFTAFSLLSRQILAAAHVGQEQARMGAFVLLLLFGLLMLIPKLEHLFSNLTSGLAGKAGDLSAGKAAHGPFGGLFVGALIGLVWTPCAGPILAAALVQVIQARTSLDAAMQIFGFAVGSGLPMLAAGYFGKSLTGQIRFLARHATAIRRAMGALVVIFAGFGLAGFNIGEWAALRSANVEEAPATAADRLVDALKEPYEAPDFEEISGWINSQPLTIEALKGKVVLVDFWTYSCINCIRTLPVLQSWHAKYKDKGLVIVGVHAPEFEFEKDRANVEAAVRKYGLTYPVALDNAFGTWSAYENRYWPAHYLIDRDGNVVYTHFGEGAYAKTENNIRHLLGLKAMAEAPVEAHSEYQGQTPETYLGTARAAREWKGEAAQMPLHHWRLSGDWKRAEEYIEAQGNGAEFSLHFSSGKAFLVMASADGKAKRVEVSVNGTSKTLSVEGSRLYELADLGRQTDAVLTLRVDPGVRMYALTFGR